MPVSRKESDVKTTLWVPRRLHRAAKLRAARDGTSVRRVVLDAIAAYLDQSREEDRR
jgi:predicted HicB family RNase H-like nuclease